jgi:hypothetical protein
VSVVFDTIFPSHFNNWPKEVFQDLSIDMIIILNRLTEIPRALPVGFSDIWSLVEDLPGTYAIFT